MGRCLAVARLLPLLFLLLPACSPQRTLEAADLLIGFAGGPPAPGAATRREVRFAVEGRPRRADLYLPGERRALAALVLVPGVAREGRRDPRLVDFARRLALARFAVWVPEIAGLRALQVSPRDAEPIADTLRQAADSAIGGGRAGLVAISYAAGPATLAALRPRVAGRLAFLLAIGGYYDATAVVTFFTTGAYRAPGETAWRRATPNAYGKWVFVRSNAARLTAPGEQELIAAIAARRLADPAAPVDDLAARLGPEGRAVLALAENRDPRRVPALIAGLPPAVRADIAALDLSRRDLARLRAPVYLLHGRRDAVIPYTESLAFAAALPEGRARVYLVEDLAHVDLGGVGLGDGATLVSLIYRILAERDRAGS